MRPLRLNGRTVHQVGLPWHWGYRGLVTGDVANDLVALSEDPNSRIMEAKALVCNIEPSQTRDPGKPEKEDGRWKR
jgi:formate dehydrogenase major subunit